MHLSPQEKRNSKTGQSCMCMDWGIRKESDPRGKANGHSKLVQTRRGDHYPYIRTNIGIFLLFTFYLEILLYWHSQCEK